MRPRAGKCSARQSVFAKYPFRRLQEIGAGQIDRPRVPGVEPSRSAPVRRALQRRFRGEVSATGRPTTARGTTIREPVRRLSARVCAIDAGRDRGERSGDARFRRAECRSARPPGPALRPCAESARRRPRPASRPDTVQPETRGRQDRRSPTFRSLEIGVDAVVAHLGGRRLPVGQRHEFRSALGQDSAPGCVHRRSRRSRPREPRRARRSAPAAPSPATARSLFQSSIVASSMRTRSSVARR